LRAANGLYGKSRRSKSRELPGWQQTINPLRNRRELTELEARYEAINKAWQDSGIPVFVLQTPDWQDGWPALHD
jgi:hypothetical protein